jgi:hypothetical protein
VPLYLIDIIEFSWKKPYFDQAAATREYVENRLSAQDVAAKFGCASLSVPKASSYFKTYVLDRCPGPQGR